MAKFVVKGTLMRGDETFAPGDEVDLDAKEAERLLAAGAVEKAGPEPKAVEPVPVAENTAPRLPASGETFATKTDEIAKRAKS